MHTVVNKLKEDYETSMTVNQCVSVLQGPLVKVVAENDMLGFCSFATWK